MVKGEYDAQQPRDIHCMLLYFFNRSKPEFILVIFIHYKPLIAVALLSL